MIDIILLTLFVNITSTILASIFGIIIGYKLFYTTNSLKNLIVVFNKTMMSMPPVVLGLMVYILFRRSGMFGDLQWLYTPKILILTQVLLITPIVIGNFYDLLDSDGDSVIYYLKVLGASKGQQFLNMLLELKGRIIIIVTLAFSRAVSEVGAVMIVGGNIKGRTRMMTTSISMLQSQGEIDEALVFGFILLIIAFMIQYVLNYYKEL